MDVYLHDSDPQNPLRPQLAGLVHDAVRVDLAVAFVTASGAETILDIIEQLNGRAQVRLLVSVLFPTNLCAIAMLARKIAVRISLGYEESFEDLHGQFHSKIVYIEGQGQSRTIVVGSHNWTKSGLDGINLEASLILKCVEMDSVVQQTRRHIEACWGSDASEPFDPSQMHRYETIQRQRHPHLDPPESEKFSGFEKSGMIAILAEEGAKRIGDSGELYLRVPTAQYRKFITLTKVWLFVFPAGTLFDRRYPLPLPRHYVGEVRLKSCRQSRSATSFVMYHSDPANR